MSLACSRDLPCLALFSRTGIGGTTCGFSCSASGTSTPTPAQMSSSVLLRTRMSRILSGVLPAAILRAFSCCANSFSTLSDECGVSSASLTPESSAPPSCCAVADATSPSCRPAMSSAYSSSPISITASGNVSLNGCGLGPQISKMTASATMKIGGLGLSPCSTPL